MFLIIGFLFAIIAWYGTSFRIFPFPTPPSVVSPLSPFDEGTSITQCFVNKFRPDFSCSRQMVGHLTVLFLLENPSRSSGPYS